MDIILGTCIAAVAIGALAGGFLVALNLRSDAPFKTRLIVSTAAAATAGTAYVLAWLLSAAIQVSGGELRAEWVLPNLAVLALPALVAGASAGAILSTGSEYIRPDAKPRHAIAGAVLLAVSFLILGVIVAAGFWLALLWITG